MGTRSDLINTVPSRDKTLLLSTKGAELANLHYPLLEHENFALNVCLVLKGATHNYPAASRGPERKIK